MPDIKIDDYVDHEFLERVNKRAAELASRAHLTAKDLDAAAVQAAAAEKTAAESPSLENEAALEKADRAFRVAQKVNAAAEQDSKKYSDWLPLAKGAAYGRVYTLGITARIASAKKADDARALLAEAEAEFKAANAVCFAAAGYGHQHIMDIVPNHQFLSSENSEKTEKNWWSANQIDLSLDSNYWVQHVLKQEPK